MLLTQEQAFDLLSDFAGKIRPLEFEDKYHNRGFC